MPGRAPAAQPPASLAQLVYHEEEGEGEVWEGEEEEEEVVEEVVEEEKGEEEEEEDM